MATRTPRIYDVALSARVSIATVSRVANGTARVDERTEARVRRAMERLGYRPHALARGLATRRSHTLGLLITDILDPYFAEIVRGAQERAESAGYVVLLGDASVHTSAEDLLVKRLLERRVDGLIVASSRTTDAYAAQLASEDIPVVCINGPLGQFAHAVQIDHRKGARLAVEHLASLGHTRIAHITGAVGVPTRQERLAGYRAALKDLGLSYDPSLVIAGVTSIADSHDAVAGLLGLAAAPTAIFAFNDRWAIGAYAAVRDAGLRIPADVSVVGFDDLEMDEWVQPALTSVRQPRREMGRIAADVLLAVLAGESASELVVVEPSLVIRGSTGTRRAHADRH
ncbi:MAG: LacI family transcriptional regulator [Chloroflexi bacterium]|nr:MAG: LacI family transcriptional regulator [Chloroflexota bacterium]